MRTSALVMLTLCAYLSVASSCPAAYAGEPATSMKVVAVDKSTKKVTTSAGGVKFSVEIPASYQLVKRITNTLPKSKKQQELLVFAPPPRGGEPVPRLLVAVIPGFNILVPFILTPPKLVAATLQNYPKLFSDYKQSESSMVKLSGREFGTATFEGHKKEYGSNLVHGFAYTAMIGDHNILIEGYDTGAKPNELPILDKAARSIKVE